MRKRKTFSLLLSLLFALTLVPVTGGTAKAEKPVIDTIIITNTDIEAPVIGNYPKEPTFTVSPSQVRINKGSCTWKKFDASKPDPSDPENYKTYQSIVKEGQYMYRYSLYVDSKDATLADQVTIIVDGVESTVTTGKPGGDGYLYTGAHSRVFTAQALPSIPGSVTLDLKDDPLHTGQTVNCVLSGGAEAISPDKLHISWKHKHPESGNETYYSRDMEAGPSLLLTTEYLNYQIQAQVSADGYSGYLTTEWRTVEAGASHSVTVSGGSANKYTAIPGETVTVSADPAADCYFSGWEVVSGGVTLSSLHQTTSSFIMLDQDVTVRTMFIPRKILYTSDSKARVGSTLTLDMDAAVSRSVPLQEAYLNGDVSYRWYQDGKSIPEAGTDSLEIDTSMAGAELFCAVLIAGNSIRSETLTVPAIYTVTFEPNGGSGTMEPIQAEEGSAVVLPENGFTPPAGQKFQCWTIDGSSEFPGAKLVIDKDTAVTAQWGADPDIPPEEPDPPEDPAVPPEALPNPFSDVKEADSFYDAVLWAFYHEPQITDGMTDTTFGPYLTVTRGQCVTFLWRSRGCPEPTITSNPFVDVPAGQYYSKAVLWAVENGITDGVDDTHFAPNDTLSTAHIITFLYRTLGIGADGWYQEAGNWAVSKNLLEGTGLTVDPKVNCPRSGVVLFLYREQSIH